MSNRKRAIELIEKILNDNIDTETLENQLRDELALAKKQLAEHAALICKYRDALDSIAGIDLQSRKDIKLRFGNCTKAQLLNEIWDDVRIAREALKGE
jgi:predicted nuclease of predicted toxin-antitoxin system